MSNHTCHALGCNAGCSPRWLMCRKHWGMVPRDLQDEVYRTVALRNRDGSIDATWAPWWRAQARAIANVAFQEDPREEHRDWYIKKADKFADKLEARA